MATLTAQRPIAAVYQVGVRQAPVTHQPAVDQSTRTLQSILHQSVSDDQVDLRASH